MTIRRTYTPITGTGFQRNMSTNRALIGNDTLTLYVSTGNLSGGTMYIVDTEKSDSSTIYTETTTGTDIGEIDLEKIQRAFTIGTPGLDTATAEMTTWLDITNATLTSVNHRVVITKVDNSNGAAQSTVATINGNILSKSANGTYIERSKGIVEPANTRIKKGDGLIITITVVKTGSTANASRVYHDPNSRITLTDTEQGGTVNTDFIIKLPIIQDD